MAILSLSSVILRFKFNELYEMSYLIFDGMVFLVRDVNLLKVVFFCRKCHKLEFMLINIHMQK